MTEQCRLNIIDHIDEKTLAKMRKVARDPSPRYAPYVLAYGITPQMADHEDFPSLLHRAFDGRNRRHAERLTRGMRMHPTARVVMARRGLDPDDLLIVSLWTEDSIDLHIEDGLEFGVFVNRDKGESFSSIRMGKACEILWEHSDQHGGGSIEMPNTLPETAKPAMIGRPIDDVLSHPLWNGLGITILDIEDYDTNKSLILTLSPMVGADPERQRRKDMRDVKSRLWSATRDGGHAGVVLRGLGVLRQAGGEFLLITSEYPPERLPYDRLVLDFDGIKIHGRMIVAFDRIGSWESDRGEPCVCWEDEGVKALIAPAEALDPDDILRTVTRFVGRRRDDVDDVYVSDLTRSLGGEGREISLEDGVMTMRGETLEVADMTWAEAHSDGDGNEFCHIVMKDGRYRQIALGDLSR